MLFGVVFAKKSIVVGSDAFVRADETRWTMDLSAQLGEGYSECKDVCLFMPSQRLLDDNSALCVYIQAGDKPWEYCGCVANAKPSDVFALRWPVDDAGCAYANASIGISVEPLASAMEKENALMQHKEEFAKRVAEDLFRYMQSFQADGSTSDRMVVPVNILHKWYEKFTNRFRRDPGFLDRPRLDTA